MNDFYVGQKFKHYTFVIPKNIITLYSIHQIVAGKITLQVLETNSRLRSVNSLITINDFTLANMVESAQFELVNDTFEIET
jgi:hypothetical protein